ncbi:uncharacterized protein DUF3939 [Salsuginibacillus halophilus]|uniref:Uncharacterized protein DUF3939 n=1 Tax=Salsuginibacillus halophilus TaxID=517424 RepID=A0A2P8HBQ4_9BACI|nr:DUF3939 domain-containing protein [Salsuginibacillus halophilus]PSL43653.1 uncharacterized protein DUF3939 [Salsuginibacillus halophilus]
MFRKKKQEEQAEYPEQSISVEEVQKAIQTLANTLPIGVSLRTFVHEDHSIDYELLKPVLKAVPRETYYMSKETYEIFSDPEIPKQMDQVQRAVDQYFQRTGGIPVAEADTSGKVSYLLIRDFLREEPDISFYVDDQMLVSLQPPENR